MARFQFAATQLPLLLNQLIASAQQNSTARTRCSQFNRLSRVARDLLMIQGKVKSLSISLDGAEPMIVVETEQGDEPYLKSFELSMLVNGKDGISQRKVLIEEIRGQRVQLVLGDEVKP